MSYCLVKEIDSSASTVPIPSSNGLKNNFALEDTAVAKNDEDLESHIME